MFNEIYNNKKVLITGNTGFKGSWLTTWLLKLGAKVYGYSIDIPSKPSLFESLDLNSKIEHYYGDICDYNLLNGIVSKINPDFIFHLAAQPIVSRSYEDPRETFGTNVMGSVNLLEAYRNLANKSVLVFITSDKCYENVEWTYGYRETDRLGGKDPYSASKAGAEIVFSTYHRSFFKTNKEKLAATARAGNVIGGGDWAANRIVPDAMTNWAKGTALEIRSPQATRPWQHVLEPISGYLRLGQLLAEENFSHVGESFNFGPAYNQNHTVLELLTKLSNEWANYNSQIKSSIKINEDKRFLEANLLKLNCDKALHQLSWEPVLDFENTIKYTAEWYYNFYFNDSQRSLYDFTINQIQNFENSALEKSIQWTISNN